MRHTDQLLEIERSLRHEHQRVHIYLPPTGPAILTTAQKNLKHQSRSEIIGPEPARDAIRAAIAQHESLRSWTEKLRTDTTTEGLVPPVVWNSIHLVVTGVTATHALLIALHHPTAYSEDEIEALQAGLASQTCDIEQAFTQATGETLPTPARRWLQRKKGDDEREPSHAAQRRARTKTASRRRDDADQARRPHSHAARRAGNTQNHDAWNRQNMAEHQQARA